MTFRQISTTEDLQQYGTWLAKQPDATLWQSLERKSYNEARGKEVRIYVSGNPIDTAAQVVIDRTTGGYSTWDISRGPIGNDREGLLRSVVIEAKKEKCIALYFSPIDALNIALNDSHRHIHCEATRILDLTLSNDDLLKQMKPKGRYNIRIAQKHNVQITESKDIDAFYALVTETGKRDRFTHLPKQQYTAFLEHLEGSFLLLALHPETQEAVAGLLGVIWNGTGIYYYGASSYEHRALMAPYVLQWHAMQLCREQGCMQYDLLGVAPEDAGPKHPWKGITRFKEQFGGELKNYASEQQIILKPMVHTLLQLKRKLF